MLDYAAHLHFHYWFLYSIMAYLIIQWRDNAFESRRLMYWCFKMISIRWWTMVVKNDYNSDWLYQCMIMLMIIVCGVCQMLIDGNWYDWLIRKDGSDCVKSKTIWKITGNSITICMIILEVNKKNCEYQMELECGKEYVRKQIWLIEYREMFSIPFYNTWVIQLTTPLSFWCEWVRNV